MSKNSSGVNGYKKIRVKVEHTIASIKIFRKVKEKFRGKLFFRENKVMSIACGLHNLIVTSSMHYKLNRYKL